jgi:hypothetical protein
MNPKSRNRLSEKIMLQEKLLTIVPPKDDLDHLWLIGFEKGHSSSSGCQRDPRVPRQEFR